MTTIYLKQANNERNVFLTWHMLSDILSINETINAGEFVSKVSAQRNGLLIGVSDANS